MRIHVKVVPKASRRRIVGWLGEALKVCVTVAPERGRANHEVEALLAEALAIAPERVRVVGGFASPRKLVELEGVGEADLQCAVAPPRQGG